MTARYIVGDVFDVLATLEPDSVDLIFSSPPFLALRSYLPADHELKTKEIGSEPTPADFLDTLLDVVEACDRVLAPHGSLCFELGDTYAGAYVGESSPSTGNNHSGGERIQDRRRTAYAYQNKLREGHAAEKGWPQPKSLCMIPTLFAASLAYGHNMLRPERSTPRWRVRNQIVWARPNPAVGALGDKYRPATSYVTVATKSAARYFDLDAVRTPNARASETFTVTERRKDPSKTGGPTESKAVGDLISQNPAGAPPLDYWVIPTHPYPGAHYATFPPDLVVRPVKSMCPAFVCLDCGTALGLGDETPRTVLRGMRGSDNGRVGEDSRRTQEAPVLLEAVCEPAYRSQPIDHEGLHPGPEGLHPDSGSGAPDGEPRGLRHGTSARDGREAGPDAATERGRSPHQRGEGRQPAGEPGADGQAAARRSPEELAQDDVPALRRARSSSEPCPACGGTLRVGRTLDPFAGSGTTLAVATGHGRDAIGIDLDDRNAELALDRVGPMFLTVERLSDEGAA